MLLKCALGIACLRNGDSPTARGAFPLSRRSAALTRALMDEHLISTNKFESRREKNAKLNFKS